jgi:hypothetical protein
MRLRRPGSLGLPGPFFCKLAAGRLFSVAIFILLPAVCWLLPADCCLLTLLFSCFL